MNKLLAIPAIALTFAFLGCAADPVPEPKPEPQTATKDDGLTYTLNGIPHELRANSLAEKIYDKRARPEGPSELSEEELERLHQAKLKEEREEMQRIALLVKKLEADLEALEAEFHAATDPTTRKFMTLLIESTRSRLKEAQYDFMRARLWKGNPLPKEPAEHPPFPPDSD